MSNLITIAMTVGLSSWLFMGGEDGEGISLPEVPKVERVVRTVKEVNPAKSLTAMSNYELLEHFSRKYDLPAALAKSICRRESWGCHHWHNGGITTSRVGAIGLMQTMSATFAAYKPKGGDIKNREHNAEAGVKYLKKLYTQYKGNIALTSAAYNAGENAIKKYNGIPPYAETRAYTKYVAKYYAEFKQAEDRRD